MESQGNSTFRVSIAPEQDPRPWPQDAIAQLVWFCTSTAEPWVPTISDLHQLQRERAARLNPPPDDTTDSPTQQFGRIRPQSARI